jgi:hypothetical protein
MDRQVVDRLREHAAIRVVAVPDTDGEVREALARLEELLWGITARAEDEPVRSSQLGQSSAEHTRRAVERLSRAVAVAEAQPPAQPIGPDGRYELVPLAWALIERADLVQFGLGTQALGRASALGGDELVADAVADVAATYRLTPADLVAEAARLHGLLSLPWDDAVAHLASVLQPGAGRVVLDEASHGAYQGVIDRVLSIWHAGDPLAWYLYRGQFGAREASAQVSTEARGSTAPQPEPGLDDGLGLGT